MLEDKGDERKKEEKELKKEDQVVMKIKGKM